VISIVPTEYWANIVKTKELPRTMTKAEYKRLSWFARIQRREVRFRA